MKKSGSSKDRNESSGFSLLEALAALLVISVALIPIFQMQAALADGSRRAELQAERILSSADVRAFLTTLNPMTEPQGEQAFDGVTLAWRAREVERIVRTSPIQPEEEIVALFQVEITIEDDEGGTIYSDLIYSVGWTDPKRATSGG